MSGKPPELAALQRSLAEARELHAAGQTRDAIASAEEALRLSREPWKGENAADQIVRRHWQDQCTALLTPLYLKVGSNRKAEKLCRDDVARAEASDEAVDQLAPLVSLAWLLAETHRPVEARGLADKIEGVARTHLANAPVDRANALAEVGRLRAALGLVELAEEIFREAIDEAIRVCGDGFRMFHLLAPHRKLSELAAILHKAGREPEVVRELYERALAFLGERFPDGETLHHADAHRGLASLAADGDDREAALRHAGRVLALIDGDEETGRPGLDRGDSAYGAVILEIAAVHERVGDIAGADGLFRDALAIHANAPDTATSPRNEALDGLRRCRGALQRPVEREEALDLARRALAGADDAATMLVELERSFWGHGGGGPAQPLAPTCSFCARSIRLVRHLAVTTSGAACGRCARILVADATGREAPSATAVLARVGSALDASDLIDATAAAALLRERIAGGPTGLTERGDCSFCGAANDPILSGPGLRICGSCVIQIGTALGVDEPAR